MSNTAKDNQKYYLPANQTKHGRFDLDITPENAGWTWSGLKVLNLSAGESETLYTNQDEVIILPLSGSCTVSAENESYSLSGRKNIWSDISDYLYLPIDTEYQISSVSGGRFAVASSRAENKLAIRYCPRQEVKSALRGCGPITRQVNNYSIGNPLQPDHVLVTEVYTPGGSWSSYPPHKHEHDTSDERALEEIYYYEMRALKEGQQGFGFQRIYPSPDFDIDVCVEIHHGDAVIMPYGYHGPTTVAPGYDLYYLNVMAGPAAGAEWKVSFDPEHFWVNDAFAEQNLPTDPRLPFYPID